MRSSRLLAAVAPSSPLEVAVLDLGLAPERLQPRIVLVAELRLGHGVRQLLLELRQLIVSFGLFLENLEDIESLTVRQHLADVTHLERLEPGPDVRVERAQAQETHVAIGRCGPAVVAV